MNIFLITGRLVAVGLLFCLGAQKTIALEQTTVISLSPALCATPGRTVPLGERPTPTDLATDAFCAEQVMRSLAPLGTLTVFGSSRFKEDDARYLLVREFAKQWTLAAGQRYPITTGGGLGVMEAANRGASEAGGKSIGLVLFAAGDRKLRPRLLDG